MLAEASTTEIIKEDDEIIGFKKVKKASKKGGNVAGIARKQLEKETGKKVVSKQNFLEEKKKLR